MCNLKRRGNLHFLQSPTWEEHVRKTRDKFRTSLAESPSVTTQQKRRSANLSRPRCPRTILHGRYVPWMWCPLDHVSPYNPWKVHPSDLSPNLLTFKEPRYRSYPGIDAASLCRLSSEFWVSQDSARRSCVVVIHRLYAVQGWETSIRGAS